MHQPERREASCSCVLKEKNNNVYLIKFFCYYIISRLYTGIRSRFSISGKTIRESIASSRANSDSTSEFYFRSIKMNFFRNALKKYNYTLGDSM